MEDTLPVILPQNNWREVFHVGCPKSRWGGPMKHLAGRLVIEDGSVLAEYECTACAARVFAGLDKARFVVTRQTQEESKT